MEKFSSKPVIVRIVLFTVHSDYSCEQFNRDLIILWS
jgi:hypothetical protein